MAEIEVVIDGLPTPVDETLWTRDEQSVIELVRKNRVELRKKESVLDKALGFFKPSVEDSSVGNLTGALGIATSAVTAYQGRRVNEKTRQILVAANKLLASSKYGSEKGDLTIVQGSFNGGGVAASAGTHDGGGAADITSFNWQNRVKVLRLLGCAAWYRPARKNVWSAHIHFIVIGDSSVSRGGKVQVTAYKNNRDGLAGNAKDPNWRPYRVNISFVGNSKKGTHYVTKNSNMYTQPYGAVSKAGVVKKGAKFTVVAKVKNSYGNVWAVNPNGKWLPMERLTTTAPKVAVATAPSTNKVPIRVATQNFGQNNTTLKKTWTKDRSPLVNLVHQKNLNVMFTQELPATSRNYVSAKLRNLKSKLIRRSGPGSGRYIYTDGTFKYIAGGKFTPSSKYNKASKPVSWFVGERYGQRYLLVDGHAQSGSTAAIVKVRTKWISQVMDTVLSTAKKYKVPTQNIILGGDWNGHGEIVKELKSHGFVSAHEVATKKINAGLKTHHSIGKKPVAGKPIDMIFVYKTRKVTAYNNRYHGKRDHNHVIAVVV